MNQILQTALETGAVSNAYCISGVTVEAVRQEAAGFLHGLYCQTGDGCGKCPACKKLAAGSHMDVEIIEMPIVPKTHKSPPSKVEVFRHRLYDFAYMAAYEGGYKTVFIPEADELSVEMQNALLKVLEEPPKKTVFLLGVRGVRRLLPTILSRCIILNAGADGEVLIEGLDEKSAAIVLKAAGGDRFLAREYGAGYFDIRADMAALLQMLWSDKKPLLVQAEALLNKYKENLFTAVNIAQIYTADVINYKYGMDPDVMVNSDISDEIAGFAGVPDIRLAACVNGLMNFAAMRNRCPGWDFSMGVSGTLLSILEVTV